MGRISRMNAGAAPRGRDSDGRPPDVLLIVLDCVRADLFDAELERPGAMPFLRALRPEVMAFTGAVSPSSWTIPGHASLFTGLYPWDHGAHYRNGPILTQDPETLAECLARSGYATALYSANAYVQAATGLTRGFSVSSWGGRREFFLRFLSTGKPTCPNLGGPALAWAPPVKTGSPPEPLRELAMDAVTWLPPVWDGLNRAGGKLLGTYSTAMPEICPWIEPELDAWLSRQPAERPVFAFVNLLEAHEPYLAGAGEPVGPGKWLSYARSGQHPVRWIRGEWTPTAKEVDGMRSSYVASLHTIDRRIRAIVETFARHHRWDDAVFVLTSDHGQAFLEHDTLFHRFRVDEPISRIPLWMRFPRGEPRGVFSDGWVSLVDVPKTLVSFVGRDVFGDPSARTLLRPGEIDPARIVYSMTDGIAAKEVPGISAERLRFLDRFEIAAYQGDRKAVTGEAGNARAFQVQRPCREIRPPAHPRADEAQETVKAARAAVELALARIASRPYHGSVERRIAGWGY
jgi:arylsulfatase A-like enzyme